MNNEEIKMHNTALLKDVIKEVKNPVPKMQVPFDPKAIFENKVLLHKATIESNLLNRAMNVGLSFNVMQKDAVSTDMNKSVLVPQQTNLLHTSQIQKEVSENKDVLSAKEYLRYKQTTF